MSENWAPNSDTRVTTNTASEDTPAVPTASSTSGEGKTSRPPDDAATPPAPRRVAGAAWAAEEFSTEEIRALTPQVSASSVTATLATALASPAALTVATVGRAWRALVDAVGDLLDGRDGIWALEAGAGTRTLFDLPEDAFIVGVDRDPRALDSNVRLDQRISVELEEYRPLAAGFDLITSWYVLDNLEDPAPILDRFAEWAGADGLVVLAVPNLRSPRGLWVRLTGKVRLRRALTPRALRRRFGDKGFTPVFQVYFEDGDQAALRRRLRLTHGWWKAAQAMLRVISLGMLDAARTDYVVVFRRDRPAARRGLPAASADQAVDKAP